MFQKTEVQVLLSALQPAVKKLVMLNTDFQDVFKNARQFPIKSRKKLPT